MNRPGQLLTIDGFPTAELDPYQRVWLPAGYLLRHPMRVTAPVGTLTYHQFVLIHLSASAGHPSRAFRHN